jgi:hypothetical protein
MKRLGETLKNHIETNHLVKGTVAHDVGISYNYLSTIFNKPSLDMALWEKLCLATGLPPAVAFSDTPIVYKTNSDLNAKSVNGDAQILIGAETAQLKELVAEKERTIQILLKQVKMLEGTNGTKTGQND